MAEYSVFDVHVDEDLSEFSRFLWQHSVPHRIIIQQQRQYLLVGNEQQAMQVLLAYRSLQQGNLQWPQLPVKDKPAATKKLSLFKVAPISLLAIILSVLGYLLVIFDPSLGFAGQLTFFEIKAQGASFEFSLPSGQPWRLFTPVFLHFSLLHISFNMLWLWDLGKRIELNQSSVRLLGIMTVIALGSNFAQAMYAEAAIFGGMSGVIYGLLGYIWIWGQLLPNRSMQLPSSIMVIMLVWLLLCMLDFTQLLGMGKVANAAHVGGLLIGLLIGLGAVIIERRAH